MRLPIPIIILLTFVFSKNSNAQVQGCRVGNLVYTHYYGSGSQNAYRYYADDVEVASTCGWTRSRTGQFTCFVYDGSGSMGYSNNYNGPYEGGTFTTINNCDLDDYLWAPLFPIAIISAAYFRNTQVAMQRE